MQNLLQSPDWCSLPFFFPAFWRGHKMCKILLRVTKKRDWIVLHSITSIVCALVYVSPKSRLEEALKWNFSPRIEGRNEYNMGREAREVKILSKFLNERNISTERVTSCCYPRDLTWVGKTLFLFSRLLWLKGKLRKGLAVTGRHTKLHFPDVFPLWVLLN